MADETAAAQEVAAPEGAQQQEAPPVQEQTQEAEVAAPEGGEQPGEETSPAEAQRPKSRADLRASVAERLRKQEQAARQPRKDDGKWTEEEARESTEQTEETPAGTEAQAEDEAAKAAKAAESGSVETETDFVSIELDARNPLYDQGITKLDGVPKALEREVRTLANAAVRGREATEANRQLEAAEVEIAKLSAKLRLLESGEHLKDSPENDPEFQQLIRQIKEHYPGQSEKIEAALEAYKRQQTSSVEREAEAVAQRQAAARSFLRTVASVSRQKYPVWEQAGELPQRMQMAVAQYGDYVDARNANLVATGREEMPPNAEEFFGWVDTNYVKDKRVQEFLTDFRKSQAESERERIAAEERQRFEEEEKARLTEVANRHSGRPPSPPPARSTGEAGPPREIPDAARHHGTRQRDLREQIRRRLSQ